MIQRVRIVLGLVAVLALPPASARAQKCPLPSPPPSADCAQPTNCCVSGALAFDDVSVLGTRWACGDVLLFEALTTPNNLCSQAAFDEHNAEFRVDKPTYAADGLDQCTGTLPHPQHWMSGSFLVATAIDYQPGVTWHHPIQDYLAGTNGQTNHIKPALEHVLASGNSPNADYMHDGVFADTIRFFCPLFSGSASQIGTPAYRASDFIHEAWHSVYGGHDSTPSNQNNQDYYYPHDHVLGPGQVSDCFDPTFIPDGASGAWDCTVGTGPDFNLSVYQLQHEFLCDLVTTPKQWVPRFVAWQAGLLAFALSNNWYAPGVSAFINTAPVVCNVTPPLRDTSALLPGRPRNVVLDVEGLLFEGATLPQDEDSLTLDEKDVLVLQVSADTPVASATWTSPAADEVWIEVRATATLQPDGNTVSLKYNVFFYEEDQDQTHCDADLTGDDCPGLNDQTNWPTLILAPPSLSVPSFLVPGMDNASNENGDDYATVVLSFSLE